MQQTLDAGRRTTRVDSLKRSISDHVTYTLARDRSDASIRDVYVSTALSIRDRLAERWAATDARFHRQDARRVYYLSLEFLMGRTMGNAILSLGLDGVTGEALSELGYRLEELQEREPDAGLGNGGLGRLAACYLDSMATLGIPGYGYGIRYEHGIFRQRIDEQGRQVEQPDNWLHDGNPWEIARPDRTYTVKLLRPRGARRDEDARVHYAWVDTRDVLAMAYDTPVPGYGATTPSTRCGCGRPRRRRSSTWRASSAATTSPPWRPRSRARPSRACCTRRTTPARARSCG
jgi:glycogen phosphorylase